jgi:hypothetical protein
MADRISGGSFGLTGVMAKKAILQFTRLVSWTAPLWCSYARQSVGIAAQPPSGDGSYDGRRFTTNPFQSGAVQLERASPKCSDFRRGSAAKLLVVGPGTCGVRQEHGGRKSEVIFLPESRPSHDQAASFTFAVRQLAAPEGNWRLSRVVCGGSDGTRSLIRREA